MLADTLCGVLDEYPEIADLAVVPLGVSDHNPEPRMRPHSRDEALAAGQQAGPPAGLWLRGWCALIGSGSAAAVVVARRV